jgi:flagellar biosynthesis protein FliQ
VWNEQKWNDFDQCKLEKIQLPSQVIYVHHNKNDMGKWFRAQERCHWWLTVAMAAFLFLPAFFTDPDWKDSMIYLFLCGVILTGVWSFRGYRLRLGVALVAGLLVILLNALPIETEGDGVFIARMVSLLIFFGWILFYTLRRLALARRVRPAILFCAVNGYLLLGLMGGLGFRLIHHFYENAFRMAEGLSPAVDDLTYFSFITFASLGYGDIAPIAPPAQSLALFLSIAGQLYTALVIGLLIGKFTYYARVREDRKS